jgi:hypothetical protein
MFDRNSKRLMLDIADAYRQLARRSEERRAKGRPKRSRSGAADRLRAEAHEAKTLGDPPLTKRGSLTRNENGAKA